MENSTNVGKYTWDIAISLCNQDIDFARKLIKSLNPSLKIFFYENKQEEIIGKSGPEEFSKIFKEQSRVIVILSRKEWSESYYTEIERNAIISRTAVKNQGYRFLLMIPLVQGEIPQWYPSTHVYIDPYRFNFEQIARFIEFKVTEEGGSVKPITVEDQYKGLLFRIAEKKSIIKIQSTEDAIKVAKDEVLNLRNGFNLKIEFLSKSIFNAISVSRFSDNLNTASFGMGEFLLECIIILPDEAYHQVASTQEFSISFKLLRTTGDENARVILNGEKRLFYYSSNIKGWSIQNFNEQASDKEQQVLFRNKSDRKFYDLINPIATSILVDDWFQKLLSLSSKSIERYI